MVSPSIHLALFAEICWHAVSAVEEVGRYWTTTKPSGPIHSIIDSAHWPVWRHSATKVTSITLPEGTKYYEGAAARQGGLVGGGIQIYVPNF